MTEHVKKRQKLEHTNGKTKAASKSSSKPAASHEVQPQADTSQAHQSARGSVYIDEEQLFSSSSVDVHRAGSKEKQRTWPDTLFTRPHSLVELENVFRPDLIDQVEQQLRTELKYTHNESDLFSYHGTADLASADLVKSESPLGKLRDALYSPAFVQLVEGLLGVELDHTARPDLSSHIYKTGDHLHSHDDNIKAADQSMSGRRVAFILYLVDTEWDNGGDLVFHTDRSYEPRDCKDDQLVCKPRRGKIAFFEVTATSYHEVTEVLDSEKGRLSISGWYHGSLDCRLALRGFTPMWTKDQDLQLINPTYLDTNSQAQIREQFAEESSVELRSFLTDEALEQLISTGPPTTMLGPPYLRRFASASAESNIVGRLLQSSAFHRWVTDVTGLPLAQSHRTMPRCFLPGDYTLLHDEGHDPQGLDIVFTWHRQPVEWQPEWGGTLHYLDGEPEEGDNSELLTLVPHHNSLALVLRTTGTYKFVKRVKAHTAGPAFSERLDVESVYVLPRSYYDENGDSEASEEAH
ncbi:uncharacterized protein L969DRAFT_93122 [Mixia osmundae IAM 14324]|uniref:Fe2OG dioxygenase domain-containing protein n=1 Tax=Mixia osmundae (strain CBS 9802 / IAM 14324 / JCM 22182 / KY 12970) TaxID=764103 RepID=G7E616_MIXOS|nr:uncharacterized protein L969DRAFT_93122 [Mixia osmundae IAM 14324]KEI40575.1 hypothetical protein L969DRAFT_93122 [Mixia osmundae IAM 14324]GAA98276.1 hypothetical protein E5Q_04959 [Mixia osmundae IAM 14324]